MVRLELWEFTYYSWKDNEQTILTRPTHEDCYGEEKQMPNYFGRKDAVFWEDAKKKK